MKHVWRVTYTNSYQYGGGVNEVNREKRTKLIVTELTDIQEIEKNIDSGFNFIEEAHYIGSAQEVTK